MHRASHAPLGLSTLPERDDAVASISMASVASVLGALLLLLACTLPMIGAKFAADDLTSAMLPQRIVESPTSLRGADAIAGLGLAGAAAPRSHATREAATATATLRSDLRRHGEALSLTELGAGLLDAHHIVAAWRASASTDVDPASRGHVVGLRLALVALALLVAVALATGLWSLARKLAPPDTLQLAVQCAFGGLFTAAFGVLTLTMAVDEVARVQLDATGVLVGLTGALLLLGAALSGLRLRNVVPVTTVAVVLLVSTSVVVALGVTV